MIDRPTLTDIQTAIAAGTLTCTSLVEHYLNQIAATEAYNIYVEVWADEARARARELDALPEAARGPLHGAVLSIKDVICYAGHEVTAASKILSGFKSQFSATAVERALAAGAIIIGRTNCDEFAMGSANEHSCYGPTRNGADMDIVPGGSSGGAAVSVQLGTCLVALGSDTGGSVRQPASFCGVYGLKPTYGRISRHGLLAYASSFDQIGLLAHHTSDIARVLAVIAGADEYDSTASATPVGDYRPAPQKSYKIAYLQPAADHPGLDPAVRQAEVAFHDQLRAAGHEVVGVDFSLLDYLVPAYYVLATAEASSNLARYDGIRYGYRSDAAKNLLETYQKSRTEGFGTEVKRRIMLGAFVLSAGYFDAYYTKGQQLRRLVREELLSILEDYDFLLSPCSPVPPWRIGDQSDDPVQAYLSDIFTVSANLAGLPALAFPKTTFSNGLPLGFQVTGRPFSEGALLSFCKNLLTS